MVKLLLIGGLGTGELCIILVVLLLLFGGTKLPALMRGAGRGIKEFKDAMNGKEEGEKKESESDKKEE